MANANKPALVVMAAGLGSRFKGLKQIQSVDDAGHVLIDYAIYDAIEAGFGEVVFIIRRDFEDAFKEAIGDRVSEKIKVSYVFQSLDDVPGDIDFPEGRVKPWGTTHAIWSAREVLKGKGFLTINADDFYGRGAFELAADFLINEEKDTNHACIGYDLVRTLSDKGTVSRGICKLDADGYLDRIDERKKIKLEDGKGFFTLDDGATFTEIPEGAVASMNLWAFKPGFIDDITVTFKDRFVKGVAENPEGFEETLSDAVQDILERGAGTVKCIPTDETWFGMTYIEDLDKVKDMLKDLTEKGVYRW